MTVELKHNILFRVGKCNNVDVGRIAGYGDVKFVDFPSTMEESNWFHGIRALNWPKPHKREWRTVITRYEDTILKTGV